MLKPQFPHSGNDLISRYRLFLHDLDDLKTLTVTSDHICSVPCLSAHRVLLATILSGVQGGINFMVNNIKVECNFSTMQQMVLT